MSIANLFSVVCTTAFCNLPLSLHASASIDELRRVGSEEHTLDFGIGGLRTAHAHATSAEIVDVNVFDSFLRVQTGCRSWLSYGLSTKGDVWLDELSLVAD